MENENLTQGQEQDNTVVVENQGNEEVETEGNEESNPAEETTTFSQEQVNDFVRSRLEKYEKRLFKRYGVEDRDGLNELFGKAQSYSVMEERYNNQKAENATLKEENAFLKNNINPAKYDDVRAYFKGKGLEFNEETLVKELETHGEWKNIEEISAPTTTITTIGTDPKMSMPKKDEKAEAAKLFGLSKLI